MPVLDCFAKIHAPKLDGVPLTNLQLAFYVQPSTGLKGVVGYIRVDSLARGRHVLEVLRVPPATLPADSMALRNAAWRQPVAIPFWR